MASSPGPTHPSGVHATPCGCASGGETASRKDIPKEHRDSAGTLCGLPALCRTPFLPSTCGKALVQDDAWIRGISYGLFNQSLHCLCVTIRNGLA